MGSSVYSMDEALHKSARNPTRATTVESHPSKNEGRSIIIPSLLRSANVSPLKVPRSLHPPLAKIARTRTRTRGGPPRLVPGVSSSLLVYILLRLEALHQAIHVALLVVRSSCQRQLHFFGRVIEFALRAVHTSQSRMYEPLVGMFLRVFAEDRERFFAALFTLQSASEETDLQRAGHIERFLLRRRGLVFAVERGQDFRLGYLVIVAIFIFDGFVGIGQGFIRSDLFREQVIRCFVPAYPRVLRKTTKLFLQAGLYNVVHIDGDLERDGDLLPLQFNYRRIFLQIVEVVGQGIVHVRGLGFHGYAQRIFLFVVGEGAPGSRVL